MLQSPPNRSLPPIIARAGSAEEKRYTLLDVLGEGGTGMTYRAQVDDMAQPVAVKSLTLSGQENWKNIERFEREAQVLAKLQHPGIPRYLDYFHIDTAEDRSFYLVQQLAQGQTLAQKVAGGWRCEEIEAKAIATQLLTILAYLHHQSPPVIHRDLKPQNIILDNEDRVSLVDFGAVQNAYYDTFMRGSTMVGTYGYMAPEQFRGQAVAATDLYGLGATLLFLLTHRSPTDFLLEDLKLKIRGQLPVSEDFGLWLEKLLEPDADDRFASAEAAMTALATGMPRPPGETAKGLTKKGAIAVGVITLTTLTLLNQFKFPILSRLGFTPREMFEQGINGGDVAVIKKYLEKGVSPNSRAYNGNTLLHWAVSNGRPEVADVLIEAGANLHQTYPTDNRTVLHLGVQHNDAALTAVLLKHGARVNERDRNGNTPLHRALLKNNINQYYGMTNTSRQVSPEIVQLLLQAGADVDIANQSGIAPRELISQEPALAGILDSLE